MPRPPRQLKKLMHIICEGEKTEPFYIRGYIDDQAKEKAKVIEVPDVKVNTPVQLVDYAVSLRNSSSTSADDEYWVVYDRESVRKYSHELHAQAWNKAQANGINIALSNVCFEIWILLHFQGCDAPYENYDDLYRNSGLKGALKSVGIENYNKGFVHLYSKLAGGVSNARKRAEILNRRSKEVAEKDNHKPFHYGCYTDVHLLLDAIDSF